MFPFDPQNSPEPDVIGTAGTGQGRRRWPRYLAAGGVLALTGIIAATAVSSHGHHAAAPRAPGSPSIPAPAVPVVMPSQAWVVSLDIANWPMPGSTTGSLSTMFAGGVAGNRGWDLTVRGIAGPGHRCVAEVLLDGTDAYPLPARPALRTPAGDLAFIALGTGSPGVGVGLVQRTGPGQVWIDPGGIGGMQISVPVLAEIACGKPYYLAGFAYPLAGKLNLWAASHGAPAREYIVPTRLSHPKVLRVWESTG
ncbi:MAG: hypothetical protein JO345_13425 [Streptosporangiaceae bacterium]|nr:hypothetical protein [Streptosporangiaceae bacterium]